MEKRYQNLSLFECQKKFPDNPSYMEHLAKHKWPKCFVGEKCKQDK